jgi:hypothetical protein
MEIKFRINGFCQIKAFYSWLFANQDKGVSSNDISLYMFLINQNNRNNWAEWFKCPFDLAMTGASIGNKKTYYNCLVKLNDLGLIEYKKGVNNWKAPLIKIVILYDELNVPLSEIVDVQNSTSTRYSSVPQHGTQPTPLPIPQPTPLPTTQGRININNKQVTENKKQKTNNGESEVFGELPITTKNKLLIYSHDLDLMKQQFWNNRKRIYDGNFFEIKISGGDTIFKIGETTLILRHFNETIKSWIIEKEISDSISILFTLYCDINGGDVYSYADIENNGNLDALFEDFKKLFKQTIGL